MNKVSFWYGTKRDFIAIIRKRQYEQPAKDIDG